MRRHITQYACAVDVGLWVLITGMLWRAGSEQPYMRDYYLTCAIGVTLLFGLTALPAFLLLRAEREPNLAMGFALAFPILFALLYAAVTMLLV
jgi:hypothetical protein